MHLFLEYSTHWEFSTTFIRNQFIVIYQYNIITNFFIFQSALSDFCHFFHGYFKFMSVDAENDIKYSALKTIELRNKIVFLKNNIYHSNTFFLLTLYIFCYSCVALFHNLWSTSINSIYEKFMLC